MKSPDTTFLVNLMQILIFLVSRSCSSNEVNSRSHDKSFELTDSQTVVIHSYIFLLIFTFYSSEPNNTNNVFLMYHYPLECFYIPPFMSFHHLMFLFLTYLSYFMLDEYFDS